MGFEKQPCCVQPRIILHGGAGNITRANLPETKYKANRNAMLGILQDAYAKLLEPNATALDIATYAVSLLENDGNFNSGHGAVFTTAGTHELEASVMVSHGYRKRGVGVMNVIRAKNPIKLAREMLIRGNQADGGGAGGHCQLQGETCNRLAEEWGLETVQPSFFWVRERWIEHRKGLGLKYDDETYERAKLRADEGDSCQLLDDENDSVLFVDTSLESVSYVPRGTVGAVVLDSTGTICAATSTGGLTNKLPGRIGDTPTVGAGFWAEQWPVYLARPPDETNEQPKSLLASLLGDCLPALSSYSSIPQTERWPAEGKRVLQTRSVGMSGTGNGDSFIRLNAVRTAAAIAQLSRSHPYGSGVPLQDAVSAVAGPDGRLQQSAEDRWAKTGEGEGGIIGIDFLEGAGKVVFDFNCGGLFRCWVDDEGRERFAVFRDET